MVLALFAAFSSWCTCKVVMVVVVVIVGGIVSCGCVSTCVSRPTETFGDTCDLTNVMILLATARTFSTFQGSCVDVCCTVYTVAFDFCAIWRMCSSPNIRILCCMFVSCCVCVEHSLSSAQVGGVRCEDLFLVVVKSDVDPSLPLTFFFVLPSGEKKGTRVAIGQTRKYSGVS